MTTTAPRRVPRGDELDSLMRLYGYRFTRTGRVAGAEPTDDPDVVTIAESAGWPIHAVERLTAVEIFERSVAAASALDEGTVLAAFVAGLGSAPSGRQIAISFGWARHLSAAVEAGMSLPDCGLEVRDGDAFAIDTTEVLLRIALGWAWNEQPYNYLPDLEAAAAAGLPTPTADDRERVRALLELVAAQPAGTTASTLEKAVARARIVPGTDKYQRYGILIGLAEIGVLPSTLAPSWDRFVSRREVEEAWSGGPRSDITPPLSGWRGGIDDSRAEWLRGV
ncbi:MULTISPECIES: hypothetical protein [unclassified Microbacterium]|uniref:hypothetical protein n=1 Tax=unclassified Microbacterium TaxID=2609290 RepID=UPI00137C8B46|nr:hypothetical protein [Microbacterium sp. MAH-37]MVQ41459.1 hypothetical protein [Microbacterium sp. MAH-37]